MNNSYTRIDNNQNRRFACVLCVLWLMALLAITGSMGLIFGCNPAYMASCAMVVPVADAVVVGYGTALSMNGAPMATLNVSLIGGVTYCTLNGPTGVSRGAVLAAAEQQFPLKAALPTVLAVKSDMFATCKWVSDLSGMANAGVVAMTAFGAAFLAFFVASCRRRSTTFSGEPV
jgi:hypothetical protein